MKLRNKEYNKYRDIILLISLVIFSTTTLWNIEGMFLYMAISAFVGIMTLRTIYKYKLSIGKIIMTPFTLWIVFIYAIFHIYGTLILRTGNYNTDFMIFNLMLILCVQILLMAIPTNIELIIVYCKSARSALLFICGYMIINNYEEILKFGNVRLGDDMSGNPNTVAVCIGLCSLCTMFLYTLENKKIDLLIYFLSIFCMFLTGSKKGILIILISFALYTILYRKPIKYIIIPSLIFIVFYMVFQVEYFYNIVGVRIIDMLATLGIGNIQKVTNAQSTALRLNYYKIGLLSFLDYPILGGGTNYFQYINNVVHYSHSNYIEILNNFGIVGFLLYYFIYVRVIKRFLTIINNRNSKPYRSFYIFIVFYVITALVLDFTMVSYSSLAMFYFPILLGSVCYYNLNKRKKKLVLYNLERNHESK